METIHYLANLILHLDQHITTLLNNYGGWTYAILFLIVFSETGLIVLPFLPGDSLLFAVGTLAAQSSLNIHYLFCLLTFASIIGNILNYSIGRFIGPRVFDMPQSWLLNPQHLIKAHHFYKLHGAQALVIARFIPILRSFAPFVAGLGYMRIKPFLIYNVLGALLWVGCLLYVSYLFGNLPFIKNNFSMVILIIITISLLPPVIGALKYRKSTSS